MITLERLKELLEYNFASGLFSRLKIKNQHVKVGHICDDGRINIKLDDRLYAAGRLAWFYHHGEWPAGEIDHINCDPTDNRICNLRQATRGQNRANSHVNRDNKSQIKGVALQPNGKWVARMTHQGKSIYLGTFPTAEAAHERYCFAAKRVNGEFARGK